MNCCEFVLHLSWSWISISNMQIRNVQDESVIQRVNKTSNHEVTSAFVGANIRNFAWQKRETGFISSRAVKGLYFAFDWSINHGHKALLQVAMGALYAEWKVQSHSWVVSWLTCKKWHTERKDIIIEGFSGMLIVGPSCLAVTITFILILICRKLIYSH